MYEKIRNALEAAYKKEFGTNAEVRVDINPDKKDIKVYQMKTVVEEVLIPEAQISLADAKAISKRYVLGSVIESEVKTKNFRRLSAGAAKSVIIQGIREGERLARQEAYENQKEEIISALVCKYDPDNGNVVVNTGTSYATLRKEEQIPGEVLRVDDRVKVFVTEVNREARGPLVTLSRIHPGLVRRMFELEIPEIADGVVMVMGVSREAGSRTKLAVMSRDPDVDPVGACIGAHGMRINAILDELNGEKIDVIKYSEVPEEYIAAALAPATVLEVTQIEERSYRVRVAPDQLSLAIGKDGQNARLAARLTKCKIDIKAD
jgi:N utilization substance protein A